MRKLVKVERAYLDNNMALSRWQRDNIKICEELSKVGRKILSFIYTGCCKYIHGRYKRCSTQCADFGFSNIVFYSQ